MGTTENAMTDATGKTASLQERGEGFWSVPSPLKLWGLVALNTRMSIVRLTSGGLLLHSPVSWCDELRVAE